MRNLEFNKYTGSYFFYNEEEDVKELTKPRNGDIIKFNDDFSYEWKGNSIYFDGIYDSITAYEHNNYSSVTSAELISRFNSIENNDRHVGLDWELISIRYEDYPVAVRGGLGVQAVNVSEISSHTTFDVAEFNEMNRLYEQELRNNE